MTKTEQKAIALERIAKLQVQIEEAVAKGIDCVYMWDEIDMLRDILREIDNECTT